MQTLFLITKINHSLFIYFNYAQRHSPDTLFYYTCSTAQLSQSHARNSLHVDIYIYSFN